MVRELGSERRETVRSLSGVGAAKLKESDLSKKVLLSEEIRYDNLANNGEARIQYFPSPLGVTRERVMTERVIPWEERMTQLDVATKAYIAGFLDGDGSIMLQIKPRDDVRFGFRLQATICFYQDSEYEKELHWFREQLQVGYISKRNDGMSELRINGFACIEKILLELREFIRFKRRQVELMLNALEILQQKMTADSFLKACKIADEISNANYKSNRKHTAETVAKYLKEKSFPVTTEA